ncbi:hypothetical protein ABIQ69_04610 [Agromyces sp. G08B096]|uniref:Uncharacterized protein n=1 Tax=Agromyces sp. G08B096 TaxID=3156399 RepID=A0AAU7W8L0_9MICO
MRRFPALLLAAATALALAGCAPSAEEQREELRADLAEQLEAVDGVSGAWVDRIDVTVDTEQGMSVDAAKHVLDEVHTLVLGYPDDFRTVVVWFSGDGEQRWSGDWGLGAIDEQEFDQQAAFVASLSGWPGITEADAPVSQIAFRADGPHGDVVEGQTVQIRVAEPDGPDEAARAELQQLWTSSGGDPEQSFQWRRPW